MIVTGFTDEASSNFEKQISLATHLDWSHISLRTVDTANVHEISDEHFNHIRQLLKDSNIQIAEFGTLIGNWSKSISSPWSVTEAELKQCIPRMHKLHCRRARIMSYAQEPWGQDQYFKRRIRRLREIVRLLTAEGIAALHENCMNYGGFSAEHTLELLNEVPDMKLVFDTGNPLFQIDRSLNTGQAQSSWHFYHAVKPAIEHIHIKDAVMESGELVYCFPGDGLGNVREIIADMYKNGYRSFVTIEPHMGKVFHESHQDNNEAYQIEIFKEYATRMKLIIDSVI